MRTILIGLITVLLNFSAFECSAQKASRLPAEMPETVEFEFNKSAGMIFAYTRIKIANLSITVEEKNGDEQNPRQWTARIDRGEQENLYRLFVENRFDALKNDERRGIIYDAGSEGISINAGTNAFFSITYGPNSPMSGDNLKRYRKIAGAINALRAKYEGTAQKTASADAAIFMFDAKEHGWLFKNAKATYLTDNEKAQVRKLIDKAANDYNSKLKNANLLIKTDEYKYQLVPVISENGEILVWANAFCNEFGKNFDWRNQLVTVDDGGKCFFNLYVNLKKNSYERFSVNGEA